MNQPVVLDLQSMASHSFIAGTNGSGKSNAVFRIIEELMEASIPFMVIEPAKGEYKNVFGSCDDVKVSGTNRKRLNCSGSIRSGSMKMLRFLSI